MAYRLFQNGKNGHICIFALKRVEKTKKKDRVTFVVTLNPKLPSISVIVNKHWKTLTGNSEVK